MTRNKTRIAGLVLCLACLAPGAARAQDELNAPQIPHDAFGGIMENLRREWLADQYRVLDSLGLLDVSPPDTIPIPPPPPPVDPPPVDPPPPPPPPPGPGGLVGGHALSGLWQGWQARHPMGVKYTSEGGYGTMASNTGAKTNLPDNIAKRGFFEVEIYYDADLHPGDGGGQHVIGIFSQSAKQAGPYDPRFDFMTLKGWLRLDFGIRKDQLNAVVYQEVEVPENSPPGNKAKEIAKIPFKAHKQWAKLRVEWNQSGDRVDFKINGKACGTKVSPGRNLIGNLLYIGNVDRNSGERCVEAGADPCGLLGKIRYRGWKWGSL